MESAQVIMDRDTGRSKGFGFVEMGKDQEAQAAIKDLNGKDMDGRALTVNEAKPREDRVSQLDQTPSGAAELQRRRKLFGECKRIEGETSGQFYARLRHWLDRDIPQTKSPLHAPRQTGD